MTRGERWQKFFESKGWLKGDVISGGDNETLKILVCKTAESDPREYWTFDTALVLEQEGILCSEYRSGTVFFQWEDILQVRLEYDRKKGKWL